MELWLYAVAPIACTTRSTTWSGAPKYSITQAVTLFKSLSGRAMFREYPQIKRQLWGGEFWEDGYFARTVGDKVTAEVIKRYIQQHREGTDDDLQLKLFEP